MLMVIRALSTTLGDTFWQQTVSSIEAQTPDQQVKFDYDAEFYRDHVDGQLTYVLYAMIAIGVTLDLACWRWRSAANMIFAFECLQLVLEGFIPIDFGLWQAFVGCLSLLLLQASVGLHPGPNIIASTLIYFVMEFFELPIVRAGDGHKSKTSYGVAGLIACLVVSTLFQMGLLFVKKVVYESKQAGKKEKGLLKLANEGIVLFSADRTTI